MEAAQYQDYKKVAMAAVLESHQRLSKQFQLIVVEGAGSPAEINLREGDVANMGFAEAVDCPVIIIADIDKGGVFAQLVGTLMLLSQSEQDRVIGFVINRFRGDISLLQSGLDWLEEKTGKPVLAVLPYLMGLHLDSEDSVSLSETLDDKDSVQTHLSHQQRLKVVVPIYPRVSNHTDLDPIAAHPQVDLELVGPSISGSKVTEAAHIPKADLIILPGSKNTRADLAWLKEQGWLPYLQQHLRYGGKVLGVCGGLQMLGNYLADPYAVESNLGSAEGLGLADFETQLGQQKVLSQVSGTLHLNNSDKAISGYEIHAGISQGPALEKPFLSFNEHPSGFKVDGFISDDNQVAGTYLHGLFDTPEGVSELITWLAPNSQIKPIDINLNREQQLNRLASVVAENLDIEQIINIYENFNLET